MITCSSRFPTPVGWHGAPFNGEETRTGGCASAAAALCDRPQIYGRLYEMLAETQRDLTAEQAAGATRGQRHPFSRIRV